MQLRSCSSIDVIVTLTECRSLSSHQFYGPVTTSYTNQTNAVTCRSRAGDLGAVELARALAASPQLVQMDLESNVISDRGATALASALSLTPSLSLAHLTLAYNGVGFAGAASPLSSLASSSSIPPSSSSSRRSIDGAALTYAMRLHYAPPDIRYAPTLCSY
eukprot:780507-Rhodomonas_salina.1